MTSASPLTFRLPDGEELHVTDYALVVAGYTGRDEASVRHHIEELAAIGVPEPDSVPAFYVLDPSLVTQAQDVAVTGTGTSGEVEPVLVRAGGQLYLSVGSDHTDRDLERDSVAGSKAACAKPVAATAVPLPGALDWDAVTAYSDVDGVRYQDGTLRELRVPTEVLALLDARPDHAARANLVMFGGTLPLIDGRFVPGREWKLGLGLPDGTSVEHSYTVTVTATATATATATDPA